LLANPGTGSTISSNARTRLTTCNGT
jgi:hypothetical protein